MTNSGREIDDLIGKMTVDEKIEQLSGNSPFTTADNFRLAITGFKMADGPHGYRDLEGGEATCFPSSLALAATWDVNLVSKVASAIAEEFKYRGANVLLGPCINMARDPRWGRTFETMGEDPFLTSQLAVAYIEAVQNQGIVSVVKHFACYNQEDKRETNDVIINERTLHEFYLPHFKACVKAGTKGIMSAYNKINGYYCSENVQLLNNILRKKWGFDGIVISDWGACKSTKGSIESGLDIEMPRSKYYGQSLLDSIKKGRVCEKYVDEAVRRVLKVKKWIRTFNKDRTKEKFVHDPQAHNILCRNASQSSIVLLKNHKNILPLNPEKLKDIAIIGPNADIASVAGGGSSEVKPYYSVSPLEAIIKKIPKGAKINFAKGCIVNPTRYSTLITDNNVRTPDNQNQGFIAEYYPNKHFEGEPVEKLIDKQINFHWKADAPPPCFNKKQMSDLSVIWKGFLKPQTSGDYFICVKSNGAVRLYLNDKMLIDQWQWNPLVLPKICHVKLETRYDYKLKIEYYNTELPNYEIELSWIQQNESEMIEQAQQVAKQFEVAILFVGTDKDTETECKDRNTLLLPGKQNELITKICECNPNTIVAIISGSIQQIDSWVEKVPVVLQCWFNGQQNGNAIADVIFGDINPSGKLPLTWPRNAECLPVYDNEYESIENLRGYRYYQSKNIQPLFCFGHGLSYTEFKYLRISTNKSKYRSDESVELNVELANTGSVEGNEIVQVYLKNLCYDFLSLIGFKKVLVQPAKTKKLRFILPRSLFQKYNISLGDFVDVIGDHELHVGASSTDIRFTTKINREV